MAENKFTELDEALATLDELLDTPETAGSPSQFLAAVAETAQKIYHAAEQLTIEDFNSEYQVDESNFGSEGEESDYDSQKEGGIF